MATKREYSPELKAAAMSALLQGQSVSSVAKEYDIPKGTVSNWKRRGVPARVLKKDHSDHSEEIGELIIGFIKETLTTLKAQSISFRDPDWLAQQDASAVAVLHGVQTDKAIRLLEALSNAADD